MNPCDDNTTPHQLPAGDDLLRIPLLIRVDTLPPEDADDLLAVMSDKLGATFFRDKDLFMEVLEDRFAEIRKPLNYDVYAAYIKLFVNPHGKLRISSTSHIEGGTTVYAQDQFLSLVDNLDDGALASANIH